MRWALRQYRIDQPDSHTVAIYGPDDFYELHDDFSKAYQRKEELTLLAALEAITEPSKAMLAAGEHAMESGEAVHVWQAFIRTMIAEYEATQASSNTSRNERKAALAFVR